MGFFLAPLVRRAVPRVVCVAALGGLLLASPASIPAAAPAKGAAKQKVPEVAEMLVAILVNGSQMGPGEGWFHPSQSRYGWKWLAERYDADRDGSITRAEFGGPTDIFETLDRNHDGVLKADDFNWSDRTGYALQSMMARRWFSRIDANSNGRVSREEWDKAFARAAKDKGYLTADDLRELFPTVPPPPPKPGDPKAAPPAGPSMFTLLRGLMQGELGSFQEGPALGDRAPDFRLKTQEGDREIRLAQFRGKKPVVLVFGSFT